MHICQYLINKCNIQLNNSAQRSKRGYNQRTALHWSCRNGHMNVIKWFLEEISFFQNNIDIESSDGTTPLCLAAWQGHVDVCIYLVSKGANPHKVNSYGCNIAMWIAQSSAFDKNAILRLAQFFYGDCHVDFTLLNSNGQGCLHKAAQRGNGILCKWLIEETVLKDDKKHFLPNEYEKSTPSQLAGYEGYKDLADYLLLVEKKYDNAVD